MSKLTITLVLCAALAACGKKQEEPAATAPPPAPGSANVVATAPADAAMPAPDAAEPPVEVPTEADFEDQAATDITEKNLATKLSTLEKDLAP